MGLIFAALSYQSFLERVKIITSRDDLSEEEVFTEMNKAAILSVMVTLGGRVLSKLGPEAKAIRWLVRGIVMEFGAVWYGH